MWSGPTSGKIGPYTLLATVAEGGMARVYLAQHHQTGRVCVLKQMHQELEEDTTAALRFRREALIASKIDHPNVARVLDAGLDRGRFYIALEFVAGQTLARLIEAEPIPPGISVGIIASVLDGLGSAHQVKVGDRDRTLVHRDINPRNVMVSYQGDVKLIDFGIARAAVDQFHTAPGVIVGTTNYMSPEQVMAEELDHRSDLYSVGVVLHEILSDRQLVPIRDIDAAMQAIVDEPAPKLRTLKPELPARLERVVAKALTKDRADRFQSAKEFRDELLSAWMDFAARDQVGAFVRRVFATDERETQWLLKTVRESDAPSKEPEEIPAELATPAPVVSSWPHENTGPSDLLEFVDEGSHTEEGPTEIAPELAGSIRDGPALAKQIGSLSAGKRISFSLLGVPLDEALLILSEARFTGVLQIGADSDPERMVFEHGTIVAMSPSPQLEGQQLRKALLALRFIKESSLAAFPLRLTNPDAELLGNYLLEHGFIERRQLLRARSEMEMLRTFALFSRREAVAHVFLLDQAEVFVPRTVDVRPAIAYGAILRSSPMRREAVAERYKNKKVRLAQPYDELKNFFRLPLPIVEALRALAQGVAFDDPPLLPDLDEMTSLGVLLLFDRLSLLETLPSG